MVYGLPAITGYESAVIPHRTAELLRRAGLPPWRDLGVFAPDTLKPEGLRLLSLLNVRHIAFLVDSEQALKDAYLTLRASGVAIERAVDHVSQKSVYFHDPDGNLLEIYYELPHARALFREGRGDRDAPLVFEA